MFSRRGEIESPYDRLADKISKELLDTLRKKGVVISKIKIDMDIERMKVRADLKER